ncbi:YraN family protein [Candidatus Peregrinibacteria bacterium CG22_combo_CG10-13_8_21_14_all_44_10]|mgnify:CR=1 FL=1|nr:MAG: hypothetical protein AUK45_02780 [Candidatus Peregrinibacteria bacterium CG2_30_44_17]PIP66008.1 MAG: YraN family protein [Candidatus Peregrinibacteria bacterium CG22_combo_CG10-13_8_21_14_all_44_10]PIX79863.1 MAG: YraN family protein [Candidatus Peregrinibacteria bacterium CG_4_10_14_3_um_filter_44_21]PJB89330.1 MAG: YraN family protein [Candidatus Peregrinibacteria bacterium CG_4_9_14_0_8_um_filter_44_15]
MDDFGENLAAEYLCGIGYKILERNFRYKNFGEVDLICMDGDEVVFVEVKRRSSDACGTPEDSIDWRKISKIARIAEIYLDITKPWRIDAVLVLGREITHLQNVL